ncbi:MAG TPA: glycosyltransferase family 4 protein [Terracidiphilus sp.]|nr:glycosyltransferase family 4 protein [Terracidiphilus sp.]
MKIAILWTCLSGYLNACLKELGKQEGVELFICHEVPVDDAPFDESQFDWMPNRTTWQNKCSAEVLAQKLHSFEPDIIILSSWHISVYRRVARKFAGKCWRIMVMDNPWKGSLKQWFGTLISPFYVRPIADAVWLPGERQAAFARKLGFSQNQILRGCYSCDHASFAAIHTSRIQRGELLPRKFLFVGRFVPQKSIDVLAEAYAIYHSSVSNPWPLICCGTGPLRSRLESRQGIVLKGFVQPEHMPDVFASAGCLILTSYFEPWALVVHEAASAGRLILASESVGAVPHLVQPGYNGYIFDNGDARGLAVFMARIASMTDAHLEQMAAASFSLSQQFTPKQWSKTLLSFCGAASFKSI